MAASLQRCVNLEQLRATPRARNHSLRLRVNANHSPQFRPIRSDNVQRESRAPAIVPMGFQCLHSVLAGPVHEAIFRTPIPHRTP